MEVVALSKSTSERWTVKVGEEDSIALLKSKIAAASCTSLPDATTIILSVGGCDDHLPNDACISNTSICSGDTVTFDLGGPRLRSPHVFKNAAYHKVMTVAMSPCARIVYSGGDDGTIHVWDTVTGDHMESLNCSDYEAGAISLIPSRSGARLYAFGGAGPVVMWCTATWSATPMRGPGDFTAGLPLALAPDDSELYCLGRGSVQAWRCDSCNAGGEGWRELFSVCNPNSFAVHPSGDEISVCSIGVVTVWRHSGTAWVQRQSAGAVRGGWERHMAYSPSGDRVYIGMGTRGVSVFCSATWAVLASVPAVLASWGFVPCPKGERLFTCGLGGTVTAWRVLSGGGLECVGEMASIGTVPFGFAISPCGEHMYGASSAYLMAAPVALMARAPAPVPPPKKPSVCVVC